MSTPAGWYPQPDGQQRYWNGAQWTDDFAPSAAGSATSAAETTTTASGSTTPAAGGKPTGHPVQDKHLIGYTATAIVALAIGAGLAFGIANAGADTSRQPTDTVTVATPGPTTTTTVPGPTITSTTTSTVTKTVTSTVTKQAPAKTVTVTAAPAPAPNAAAGAIPGDGTFQVGADIQPGTYVSAPPAVNCYWARLSSPNAGDIIANNNSSGQSVVTILASDKFFESSGCSGWTRR
jgi:hypothetical protein